MVILHGDARLLHLEAHLAAALIGAIEGLGHMVRPLVGDHVALAVRHAVPVALLGVQTHADGPGLHLPGDAVEEKEDQAEKPSQKIAPLSDRILKKLDNDYDPEQFGITIHAVKIKMLDLPDENKDAVYNRMITERKNIAAAYKAQGESEAQKIRNMTDKETEIMISEASAKAAELEAEGEAEYMKILSDAYNDEEKAEYYLFVRQLDAARKSLKNGNTTLFLDKDSPIADIFAGE